MNLTQTLYDWCLTKLKKSGPAIIGLNGPQGAGKTTVTTALCAKFQEQGYSAVTISIDDFYLTRAEQMKLATAHRNNPYLQSRGYPGTHDIELGVRTLKSLKEKSGNKSIPTYDKSAYSGKGDRALQEKWKTVTLPLNIIFFEGWMLGYRPTNKPINDNSLKEINQLLKNYDPWWDLLDAMIQLKPKDYRYVLDWRVEAEEKMKASGKPGMTTDEIRAYINTFLPAYEMYLPQLASRKSDLIIEIGKDRNPI